MTVTTDSPFAPKIFTRGTLTYTKKGLYMLFFWLMWNNFCFTIFENVRTYVGFLFKDNGASYTIINLFGSVTMVLNLLITPALSTYSDRFRSRWGRRRPFLIAAAPPLAVLTMAIPYMPELGKYLMKYPALVSFWSALGVNGPVFCIGTGLIIFTIVNLVIASLFIYYWWDVVPEEVLGRFTGLTQIITAGAMFVFNYFLFGLGQNHLKALFFGLGLFFLIFYITSTVMVKEGEYPPPEPRKEGDGLLSTIKTYFAECYTKPRYLWIFGALTIYQIGNMGYQYQVFYLLYDVKIPWDTYGKFTAWPSIILFVFGYSFGSVADKLKPVRLMGPCLLVWCTTLLISYYCVHDKWSFLICNGLVQLPTFAIGIFMGVLVVEVYPREKLGQFCSAAVMTQTTTGLVLNPLVGMLFDHLHNNRMGYLWSAGFEVFAALCFFRIYHNWKKLHPDELLPGEAPEPLLAEGTSA